MNHYQTSLVLVTDATVYPLTLADAKLQLNLNESETAFDDYLTGLIATVAELLEHDTQLTLVNRTWRYSMPLFPDDEFTIPMGPISSITHIKYYDTGNTLQTLSSAYYSLDGITGGLPRGNSRIYLNEPYTWPSTYDRPDAAQVTFVSGYGAVASNVPATLKHAMKLLLAFLFEHRGEPVSSAVAMYPAYDSLIARFRRATYP